MPANKPAPPLAPTATIRSVLSASTATPRIELVGNLSSEVRNVPSRFWAPVGTPVSVELPLPSASTTAPPPMTASVSFVIRVTATAPAPPTPPIPTPMAPPMV